jgi:hypothetical protein
MALLALPMAQVHDALRGHAGRVSVTACNGPSASCYSKQ